MTIGEIIVIVSLLAQMYGVSPDLMDCIAYRESSYNASAVNGVCIGPMQWHPDTLEWLGEKASNDPLWMHGYMDSGEPVYQIALAAYSIRRGYGRHWSTFSMCEEVQ